MEINNFLQMNDWKIGKFVRMILSIQLMLWGVIALDQIGFQIPILRQIVGFIYLTFIPGVIILRILKMHELGNVRTVLYSMGLSISTLMFAGFFINKIFMVFNINAPITFRNIVLLISVLVLLLLLFSCIIDKNFFNEQRFNLKRELISSRMLFVYMLPFIAILGTYTMNFGNNNILLLFLLLSISLIPILVTFDKFSKDFFPLIILILSVSLILHRSLISSQLWGSDIFEEYYFAKMVISTHFWNPSLYSDLNAMLSVVLLPAIYHYICKIDLINVFKIVYPLIFSFIPLGLYKIFETQTSKKIAFLAAFLFMSMGEFYGVLPALARQGVGTIFLVLLVMLIVSDEKRSKSNSILYIAFGLSLVVSHYALTYIFLGLLLSTWLILKLTRGLSKRSKVTFNGFLVFLVFVFMWYVYNTEASTFSNIIFIIYNISVHFYSSFLDPSVTEGLGSFTSNTSSLLYSILKYLYAIIQFFILVGVTSLALEFLFKKKNIKNRIFKNSKLFEYLKIEDSFAVLSFTAFGLLVATIIVPYFAGNLGTLRLFQIALIFLAPFFIIGLIISSEIINRVFNIIFKHKRKGNEQNIETPIKIASFFLLIILLFNSGFFIVLLNDPNPNSISLSLNEDYRSNNLFTESEICGASYLKSNTNNTSVIFTDVFGRQILRGYIYPKDRIIVFNQTMIQLPSKSYIYLKKPNIGGNLAIIPIKKLTVERPYLEEKIDETPFYNSLIHKNKIYADGDSEIYR